MTHLLSLNRTAVKLSTTAVMLEASGYPSAQRTQDVGAYHAEGGLHGH